MRLQDFRFATRPVWLLGHLVLVVSVTVFVALGLWQLDRNAERSELDARIEARLEAPAVALSGLVSTYGSDPAALELRRVLLTGTFLTDHEVIWQARTRSGISGHDVLTPLQTDEAVIIVDRGWVPIDVEGPPVVGALPPTGEVVAEGVILKGQTRQGLGPIDPATGVLERISRVDLARLSQQIPHELAPFYVQLTGQQPPQAGELPIAQVEPAPGTGPSHLSYAVQWFIFAAVALVSYPILLWRTSKRRGSAV